jgi:hypothetical protein
MWNANMKVFVRGNTSYLNIQYGHIKHNLHAFTFGVEEPT